MALQESQKAHPGCFRGAEASWCWRGFQPGYTSKQEDGPSCHPPYINPARHLSLAGGKKSRESLAEVCFRVWQDLMAASDAAGMSFADSSGQHHLFMARGCVSAAPAFTRFTRRAIS